MMAAKEKNSLVSRLRFKEFKDNWKSSTLDSLLSEFRLGGNYENSESESGIPLIKMGNLGRGNITIERIQYITEGTTVDEKDKINYGDLFFNTRNTLELVGKVAIWRNELPLAYYNSNLMYMKFDNNFFMNYRFNSFAGIKGLRRLATGTTSVAAIYTKDLLKLKVTIPSLPEQEKIAAFLGAVDEKIQQLTRKKQLLEQYKKGIMQQLFSGKLRFKDENGKGFPKWEEKKLGEVCTFFSGGTPSSTNKKYYSGTIPFIGSGNIYDDTVSSYITEEALNSSSAKMVDKGDLLYALYGANSGEVAISKIKGAINQAILCIRTKECKEYLYYTLLFNKDVITSKYLQGGQGNLSANIIKGLKYRLPSQVEQKKIANFLSSIDNKINGVNKELENANQFKKGLLQQMFV